MADRPRILYITHRVPFPPDKGDRIRNWNVLKQLAAHANVDLLTLADEPVSLATRTELNRVSERVVIAPLSRWTKSFRAVRALLTGRSISESIQSDPILRNEAHAPDRDYDAAIVSTASLAPYLWHDCFSETRSMVDVVDVDSQKWLDFAASSGFISRWLYRYEASCLRKLEKRIAISSDVTLVSDAETQLFNDIVSREVAITATNGVDLEYFTPSPPVATGGLSRVLSFAGAMDYLPNVDAATWFVREVWPAIHAKHPDAEFRIVGRNPTDAVRKLAANRGVIVTGSVPDVRPCFADAAIAVVPMRLSRGLQNKVLEALAMGKATIASPPALAALKAVPGRDLMQATTPEDWIDAITQLLNDESRRLELGANGRRFVEENHDWATCLKPLIDGVLTACSAKVPV